MVHTRQEPHKHRDLWLLLAPGVLAVFIGALTGAALTHGGWSVLMIVIAVVAGLLAAYMIAAVIWGLPLPGGFEPPPSTAARPPSVASRLLSDIFSPPPEERERRARDQERHAADMKAETARQQRIINALYREYLDTHADVDAAMRAGTADLPREWAEQRLAEMGEQFDQWQWQARWQGRYRPDV